MPAITRYTPATAEQFNAAPVVIRARSQIGRLQEVIDHGEGDLDRAAKIIGVLERGIENCFETQSTIAVSGNTTLLHWTLSDWAPAINSVCWSIDRLERAA